MSTERVIRVRFTTSGAQQVNQEMTSIGRGAQAAARNAQGLSSALTRNSTAAEQMARSLRAANDNASRFAGGIGKSSGALSGLGSAMSGVAGKGGAVSAALDNIRGRAAGSVPAIGSMVGSLAKMGPIAGIVGTVALAILAVGTAAIDAASKVEVWKANLFTITGSAQKAEESYAALVQFASKTPFDLGQSVEGFIKLRTLGLEATEGALTSFGNTAAAMGKPLNQMIEAVADAATGEFERLKEFGIKSKTQGDMIAFTFAGVTTKVKNNAADIQKYLEGLGNTKFAGAMARQMDTISGKMSNVQDAIFQAFAAFGGGQLGQAVKTILGDIAAGVGAVTPLFASMGNVIGSIVGAIWSVLKGLAGFKVALIGGAEAGTRSLEGLTIAFNLVAEGFSYLGKGASALFGLINSAVSSTIKFFSDSFFGLLEWMGISFDKGGRSWGNSVIGILRAVKAVVGIMPQLFSIAINDVLKMFSSLGGIVGRLLSGDLSALKDVGSAITSNFSTTARAFSAAGRIASAVYADQKGAAHTIERLKGNGGTTSKLDSGTVVRPKPEPGKNKPGGASGGSGQNAAQELADLEAKTKEFWADLTEATKIAGMLPLDAARYNKELELRKILGGGNLKDEIQLSEVQRQRIADGMRERTVAAALTDMREATRKAEIEGIVNQQRRVGLSGVELQIEDAISDRRKKALEDGATITDLNSNVWKVEEERLRTILRQNAAYDEQKAKLAEIQRRGADLVAELSGRTADPVQRMREQYARDKAAIAAAAKPADFQGTDAQWKKKVQDAYKQLEREHIEGLRAANLEFFKGFSDTIGKLASIFGGKFGEILNSLQSAFEQFGEIFKDKGGLAKIFKPGSPLMAGLEKFSAGAGMGAAIADLASAIGIKGMSKTGAAIGGGLGSFLGPVGSIVGSLLGGVIGGLFKKAPSASAVITNGVTSVRGNNAGHRDSVSKAANSVSEALQQIADRVGGKVGNYAVSIGRREDHYRVSGSATTRVGDKHPNVPLLYNGTDPEEALRIAIADAIRDGAITGISDLADKALKSLDTDRALTFIQQWTDAMADFEAMTDPVTAAVKAVRGPLDALREQMVSLGAASDDLAKMDEYRAKKLQQVLDEQLSGLNDFKKALSGQGSGVTAMSRLQASQEQFALMQADIAAGKQVDQTRFTSLGQEIFSLAGEIYGTSTSAFQSIRAELMAATDGAIANVQAAYNDATAVAIQQQTDTLAAQNDTMIQQGALANEYQRQNSEYLRQMAESILGRSFDNGGESAGRRIMAVNGMLV